MIRTRALAIGTLLAVGLAACSDGLGPVDLGGDWQVTAFYTGGTLRCRVEASLYFPADPATGPGTYQEQQVDCFDGVAPLSIQLRSYGVVHSIENRYIIFVPYPRDEDGDCAALKFDGSMRSETTMGGNVHTFPIGCQGIYLLMQGTWTASRVNQ